MIYFDNCATTAVLPEAAETMARVTVENFGNPSSIHAAGRSAAKVVSAARETLAASISARPSEIVLTASGTEGNNLVLGGLIVRFTRENQPVHIITTAAEHPSVRDRLAWEVRRHPQLISTTEIHVSRTGGISEADLRSAIRPGETRLFSILHGNNETGVVQNLETLKRVRLTHPEILLHLDWVQSYLKTEIDVNTMPVDFLVTASHKVHGPRGTGFVFVRTGAEAFLEPMTIGGAQEKFRRAGTENVAAVAGFAEAVQAAPPPAEIRNHLIALERIFFNILQRENIPFRLNAPLASESPAADSLRYDRDVLPTVLAGRRLPGVFNLTFPGIENKEDLLIACDLAGVMISSTSACHSGVVSESHVLAAMGLPPADLAASIRIGLSRLQSDSEVAEGAARIAVAARRIRDASAH